MSQYAILQTNDITGFVYDSSKGIATIFLNSGGVCVLTRDTIYDTLKNYCCENLCDLFAEIIDRPDGIVEFGTVNDGVWCSVEKKSKPSQPEVVVEQKKRSRF